MLRQSSHITFLSILLVLVSCPNPPEETICGQGMILVNETCACIPDAHPSDDGKSCDCDTLYHWSDDLTECILDTTSHDFTWIIDTLGAYGSELQDVAVVDANNIWVVGELAIPDSANWGGIGNTNYNAAHWNGNEWTYLIIVNTAKLYSIHYFAEDDIWVNSGVPKHWNGVAWEIFNLWDLGVLGDEDGGVFETWGTSSSNMYFAGKYGSIVHYDGTTFTKIDYIIDTDYQNITGTPDGEHVFIIGNPPYRLGEQVVLHSPSDPQVWEEIAYPFNDDPYDLPDVYSADVYGDLLYVPTGEGIWIYNFITGSSELIRDTEIEYGTGLYSATIVHEPNNIFYGGGLMYILHFNGQTYSFVDKIQNNYSLIEMKGGDYNGEIAVMAGHINAWQHGLVARGYR